MTSFALDPVVPILTDATASAEPSDRKHAILSSTPPGKGEVRIAFAVIAVSALAFAAALPFTRVPLVPIPAFIPAYESALVVIDFITAVLLLGQFAQVRSRDLLVLAAGYLFDALVIIPHALSFPGAFSPTGLLGAGGQGTAWLYMFWHGGFPLFVMGYALMSGAGSHGGAPSRGSGLGLEALVAATAVLAIVGIMTVLATNGQDALPAIMQGNRYSSVAIFVVGAVWALSLVAFVLLWRRRRRSVLDLWLMVVMFAWIIDIALSAMLNAGRFDLGFYAGRFYGLIAASFVLAVVVLETTGLYSRLARTTARLELDTLKLKEDVQDRIAEQRKTEAQLRQAQKMEAIGQLTGGLAHDFNNLLGIIIGNLDLLEEQASKNPDALEVLDEARAAALRGAELNRGLLAFARRQPLQPKRTEVNALVEGLARLLGRTLGEHIEITVAAEPNLWHSVIDPAQLESSLTNLCVNARDAMPGGGRITIVTRNDHVDAVMAEQLEIAPGDYIVVEVTDSGSGMPPEIVERVFEPFFTTKETGKGTGLGLSMVFGFVKQSGGHVKIYSEVGHGTTIRLYLPRAEEEAVALPAASETVVPGAEGEVVLAVEDNEKLRRVLVRQLSSLGYAVLEADNGNAALDIVRGDSAIALLLTDVVMPGGMSGWELAAAAKDLRPDLKILFSSGFPEAALAHDGTLPADVLILGKPYRKPELAQKLREALAA